MIALLSGLALYAQAYEAKLMHLKNHNLHIEHMTGE